ncbi:unnamed protein product [Pleuronectes platessa]|uniref:Uncharacterized protein n=1 Tax=Pleuronectes platessa TaxID=8262 RepID=A0A9N7V298_PLEPL|nr:unnamed protein product [Pleuronectes platessa]
MLDKAYPVITACAIFYYSCSARKSQNLSRTLTVTEMKTRMITKRLNSHRGGPCPRQRWCCSGSSMQSLIGTLQAKDRTAGTLKASADGSMQQRRGGNVAMSM